MQRLSLPFELVIRNISEREKVFSNLSEYFQYPVEKSDLGENAVIFQIPVNELEGDTAEEIISNIAEKLCYTVIWHKDWFTKMLDGNLIVSE